MNTTKTWFGILILLILSLLIFAPLAIRPYFPNDVKIGGVTIIKSYNSANVGYNLINFSNFTTYSYPENNSCFVSITEPTIIIRLDDVRAYSKPTESIINEILKHNMSVAVGVIPRDLEKDKNMINYLLSIKDNPKIEIMQHGVYHNDTDQHLTENDLIYGLNKMRILLHVKPATYSIPYNNPGLSPALEKILSKYFRGATGAWGIIKEGSLAQLGHSISNYALSFDHDKNILDIINVCNESLERTNYCVILIHPQEFAIDINNPTNVSQEKIQDLNKLLNGLSQLNTTSKTFKDVFSCSEQRE